MTHPYNVGGKEVKKLIKQLEEAVIAKFGKRVVKDSRTNARERAWRALDVLRELLEVKNES